MKMTAEEVVTEIIESLRSFYRAPEGCHDVVDDLEEEHEDTDVVDATIYRVTEFMAEEISQMGVLPEKEVMDMFERER